MKDSLIQAGCNDLAIYFTFLCHRQDTAGSDWGSYPLSDQYMLFSPPNISFLYTDQLGEIPLQKLAAQIQCRCLHWPGSMAHCRICPEHYPVSQWSPDTVGALPCWPCLCLPRAGGQTTRTPPTAIANSTCPCMVHPDTYQLGLPEKERWGFFQIPFWEHLSVLLWVSHYWNVQPLLNMSVQFQASDGFLEF